MRRVILPLGFILAFAAGWGAALFGPEFFVQRIKSEWYTLTTPPLMQGVTYSAAFFTADIALPDVKSVRGAAKFVTDSSSDAAAVRLGYKVQIEVAPLDLSKVPEKYKKERPIESGGKRKFTRLPIEQVTYDVQLKFVLKDKDGFALASLLSDAQRVSSGESNAFQTFALGEVTHGIATRTTEIEIYMSVNKCLTCEAE